MQIQKIDFDREILFWFISKAKKVGQCKQIQKAAFKSISWKNKQPELNQKPKCQTKSEKNLIYPKKLIINRAKFLRSDSEVQARHTERQTRRH